MQKARNVARIFDRLTKHRRYIGTVHFQNDSRDLNGSSHNKALARPFRTLYFPQRGRNFATAQAKPAEKEAEENPSTSEYHSIITDKEKVTGGPSERHQFQAETKMLLDIVAKSLYSEKEAS